jgi:hypothetical protein
MSEATIQRCTAAQCVDGLQRAHETVKATRPGYCSWCWNEIPAVDPTAAAVKRLLDARNLLINGTDGDDLEFAIGEIEAAIQDLGGSLPIYRVRGVMLHDTKDPDYTYTDHIFQSVDAAQEWIDGDSDLFCDACTIDTESDPTLEGYRFDDLEIVRVASIQFPIEILEVM